MDAIIADLVKRARRARAIRGAIRAQILRHSCAPLSTLAHRARPRQASVAFLCTPTDVHLVPLRRRRRRQGELQPRAAVDPRPRAALEGVPAGVRDVPQALPRATRPHPHLRDERDDGRQRRARGADRGARRATARDAGRRALCGGGAAAPRGRGARASASVRASWRVHAQPHGSLTAAARRSSQTARVRQKLDAALPGVSANRQTRRRSIAPRARADALLERVCLHAARERARARPDVRAARAARARDAFGSARDAARLVAAYERERARAMFARFADYLDGVRVRLILCSLLRRTPFAMTHGPAGRYASAGARRRCKRTAAEDARARGRVRCRPRRRRPPAYRDASAVPRARHRRDVRRRASGRSVTPRGARFRRAPSAEARLAAATTIAAVAA